MHFGPGLSYILALIESTQSQSRARVAVDET